ncbi:hypothetical protein TI05_18840 [Achromatium sp. WMS3]|nr:hypothetical protein TI05_18840 [Achromatium sp. WMS3]
MGNKTVTTGCKQNNTYLEMLEAQHYLLSTKPTIWMFTDRSHDLRGNDKTYDLDVIVRLR